MCKVPPRVAQDVGCTSTCTLHCCVQLLGSFLPVAQSCTNCATLHTNTCETTLSTPVVHPNTSLMPTTRCHSIQWCLWLHPSCSTPASARACTIFCPSLSLRSSPKPNPPTSPRGGKNCCPCSQRGGKKPAQRKGSSARGGGFAGGVGGVVGSGSGGQGGGAVGNGRSVGADLLG